MGLRPCPGNCPGTTLLDQGALSRFCAWASGVEKHGPATVSGELSRNHIARRLVSPPFEGQGEGSHRHRLIPPFVEVQFLTRQDSGGTNAVNEPKPNRGNRGSIHRPAQFPSAAGEPPTTAEPENTTCPGCRRFIRWTILDSGLNGPWGCLRCWQKRLTAEKLDGRTPARCGDCPVWSFLGSTKPGLAQ